MLESVLLFVWDHLDVMGWFVATVVLGAPKFLDALDFIGKLPTAWRNKRHRWAEQVEAQVHRDEVLDQLVANSESILAEFKPDHGHSLKDKVDGIAAALDAHLEENAPLMERFLKMEHELKGKAERE